MIAASCRESLHGDLSRVSTPDLRMRNPCISLRFLALLFHLQPSVLPQRFRSSPPPLVLQAALPILGSSFSPVVSVTASDVGPSSEEPSRYLIVVTNNELYHGLNCL
jgi:hypothetical protein